MDITYTQEFDAKRYRKLLRDVIAVVMRYVTAATWCFAFAGLALGFANWIGGYCDAYSRVAYMVYALSVAAPWLLMLRRRICVTRYMKILLRQMNGATTLECRLTDTCYRVTCGEMEQKIPWESLATHYHFFGDDTVALLMPNAMPTAVIMDLSAKGIDRTAFAKMLRTAGLRTIRESRIWKFNSILSCALGVFMLLMVISHLVLVVTNCKNGIRANFAHERLMEALETYSSCRLEMGADNFRLKVIRTIAGNEKPDELLYVFDDSAENDKMRVLARYGTTCYEIRYPSGHVLIHTQRYWSEWDDMFKRTNPVVFREPRKSEWLKKARAYAKKLEE